MQWARAAEATAVEAVTAANRRFEFALAVPIFMAFICVIIDISFYYYLGSRPCPHVVRSTLRDAVVGRHHSRTRHQDQTPRERLIELMKEPRRQWERALSRSRPGKPPIIESGDTVVITPEECYNSNEFITIELQP
jgi:hypothetical protein